MQLIAQIHPDKEVRDHYLTVLATGIYGKVIQHFFIAKGVGGNGKSVINSLMMRCVGKYGYCRYIILFIEAFFFLVVRQIVANVLLHTKGALNNISLELSIHL